MPLQMSKLVNTMAMGLGQHHLFVCLLFSIFVESGGNHEDPTTGIASKLQGEGDGNKSK